VLLAALGAGYYGLGRSLWLDEAWVGNSVLAPSLGAMFFHTHWLQVNPPVFLMLVRAAVRLFGLSNESLRLVPLLLGVTAAGCMLAAGRRLVSPGFAVLAAALLAFHPNVIEYSHTLKPYSGEAAASAAVLLAAIAYLQDPDRSRFAGLMAVTMIALPLAYPAVFLLPGIVLVVWHAQGWKQAALAVALAGIEFGIVYGVFIRPNTSPALREFFRASADAGITPGVLAALLFVIAAAAWAAWRVKNGSAGIREWVQLLCLLPCLLLAVAGILGWYPNSHRTRLFVLPGFIMAVILTAEQLLRRWRFPAEIAALCLALAAPVYAIAKEVQEHRNQPEENSGAAVRFLEEHAAPGDLVLVHPSTREGFLLYSAMDGWQPPPGEIVFTNTGWPCCQRDADPKPGGSTAAAVKDDLDARVPRPFARRVWLYSTTRPTHWEYVGLREQDETERYFSDRGCISRSYNKFENLAIRLMECPASP
jgi:hypothetical protein